MKEQNTKLRRIVDFKQISYCDVKLAENVNDELKKNVWHDLKLSTLYDSQYDLICTTVCLIRYEEQ